MHAGLISKQYLMCKSWSCVCSEHAGMTPIILWHRQLDNSTIVGTNINVDLGTNLRSTGFSH